LEIGSLHIKDQFKDLDAGTDSLSLQMMGGDCFFERPSKDVDDRVKKATFEFCPRAEEGDGCVNDGIAQEPRLEQLTLGDAQCLVVGSQSAILPQSDLNRGLLRKRTLSEQRVESVLASGIRVKWLAEADRR
jgi:hypothetical protein